MRKKHITLVEFIKANSFWLFTIVAPLFPIILIIFSFVVFKIDDINSLIFSAIETLLFYNIMLSSINVFSTADNEEEDTKNKLTSPIAVFFISIFMYTIFFLVKTLGFWDKVRNMIVVGMVFIIITVIITICVIKKNKKYDVGKTTEKIKESNLEQQQEFKNSKKIKNYKGVKL